MAGGWVVKRSAVVKGRLRTELLRQKKNILTELRFFFLRFCSRCVQVGAVDCSGKTERFCVNQGVREFPGVALVIDGKATAFDGNTGGCFFSNVCCLVFLFLSWFYLFFSRPFILLHGACCDAHCCVLVVWACALVRRKVC